MEINLDTEIQYLKGVGPKIALKLNKLGIFTVSDLIYHYPRRYEDYTQITRIVDLSNLMSKSEFLISNKNPNDQNRKSDSSKLEAESYTIRARIVGISNKRTRRRGFMVTEAVVADGSGTLKVVWFNQPYLLKMLRAGSEVILNGKVGYDPYSETLTMESPNRANRPKIVPVYPETAGVSSYFIARLVSGIRNHVSGIKEFLPNAIIEKYQLLGIQEAFLNIHEPQNMKMLGQARRRIAFDELFLIALRSQIVKGEIERENALRIEVPDKDLKKFADSLPFTLTPDQKKAAWEIILDLKGRDKPKVESSPSRPRLAEAEKHKDGEEANSLKLKAKSYVAPMSRLLNGDVGSGKTAVAAFAAYVAVKAGYRAAFMAPTEILAKQHFDTLCQVFAKQNISVGLITAAQAKFQNPNTKCQINSKIQISNSKKLEAESRKLKASQADLIIGTHALLQNKIKIENLGLVIVDEQHRFGVNQRHRLAQSGERSREKGVETPHAPHLTPHFLSMTATPIPRSLHLALFGDLDLSIIRTMPEGRKPIKTRFVDGRNRDKAYQFIRDQIKSGRQAFVICPLIEETGTSTKETLFDEDRKSVLVEYEKLSKEIFPDLKIGMLHGRMKSSEKDEIMADFKSGQTDILVSTSVVEVGVDIPNASIMMIEDAERFGLAQLHQFRGRVGRAEHQSYCFVFSSSGNPKAIERLKSFENILDGFKLAEIDLHNRGAGDMFGIVQSGYNELRMASYSDIELIDEASAAAKSIAPDINKYKSIKEKIGEFMEHRHLE